MLQVLFDRVLAKELDKELTLKSGITISEKNVGNLRKAKVESIGEGIYENGVFVPMKVRIGDIIVYEEHVAIRQKIGDSNYVILRQIDILGIQRE